MDSVRVRWSSNRQFIGWDEVGHGVVMDATDKYKGEGTGVRPVELVLYALGGCTAMDVVSVLEKKRQHVTGVELLVEGVQREDDFPHYYERINVHYTVRGSDVTASAVERAIELSEQKYCSVKGMFGAHVKVTTTYDVVIEDGPDADE